MKKSNVFSTLQVVVVESAEDAKAYNDNSMNESYKQVKTSYLLIYSGV